MEYHKELYAIKYACRFNRKNSVLLGFILNTSTYDSLGFGYGDKNYLPVFTLEDDEPMFGGEWGLPNKNTANNKFIVFFKGNDDCSYGLRFSNRALRDKFVADHLDEHGAFTEFIRTKCLYFN